MLCLYEFNEVTYKYGAIQIVRTLESTSFRPPLPIASKNNIARNKSCCIAVQVKIVIPETFRSDSDSF